MEDFIKRTAATEGWTDATTATVLAGVLQRLVDMGAAESADLEAMVRERGGLTDEEDEGPEDGDVVRMRKQDVMIVVEQIPDDQPEAVDGIWTIIDGNGDEHRIEREGIDEPWYVVVPSI